jgi:hypothetical protein
MIPINTTDIKAFLAQQNRVLATMQADGYSAGWMDWEALGRCYYYLRDGRAHEYLLRAADAFPAIQQGPWLIHRANLYALAGDQVGTTKVVGQLQDLKPTEIALPKERHFHLFLLACGAFLIGDYATGVAYQAPYVAGFTPDPPLPHRAWPMELAHAQMTRDGAAAQALALHLAEEIIRCEDQPWDAATLNHWDWYERATVLAQSLTGYGNSGS